MAITFTQAAVDRAVTYLMTGGPNGGELTTDQFEDMSLRKPFVPGLPGISDFILCIQLAINQNHAGLGSSRNIIRDPWGSLFDAFYTSGQPSKSVPPGASIPKGPAQTAISAFGVSISG